MTDDVSHCLMQETSATGCLNERKGDARFCGLDVNSWGSSAPAFWVVVQQDAKMDAASRPAEGCQRQQWLRASALPSALVQADHLTPGAGPYRQQAALTKKPPACRGHSRPIEGTVSTQSSFRFHHFWKGY